MMKKIDEYLKDLSLSLEGKEYEFKVELNKEKPLSWLKTVAAFANDGGGVLFIGVTNEGYAKGFKSEEADKVQIYFCDMVRNRILPKIDFSIKPLKTKENTFVLIVYVPECKEDTTVRYKENSQSPERVFRRYPGSTYELMTINEIVKFSIKKGHLPIDKTPTDYLAKNYTFNTLEQYYKDKTGSVEGLNHKQLKSFGLITNDGYLTLAGLYFTDKIKEHLPAIFMRKWAGLNKGSDEIIDSKEFYGNLIEQLKTAEQFVRNNSRTGLYKTSHGDRNVWSYPPIALLEALVNALAHRDYLDVYTNQIDIDIYADRLEIVSPGNFLPEGNAQDYQDLRDIPSVRRNEAISDTLTACGLMQRSGSGFDKIVEAYKPYGEKYKPEVFSRYGYFTIILKDVTYAEERFPEIDIKLPRIQKIVYETILNNPGLRKPDLSKISNIKKSSIENALRELRKKDLIEFVGSSRDGGYFIKTN